MSGYEWVDGGSMLYAATRQGFRLGAFAHETGARWWAYNQSCPADGYAGCRCCEKGRAAGMEEAKAAAEAAHERMTRGGGADKAKSGLRNR